MTPQQQMAALQASTAMHLLHAGANMLLMQTGMLAAAAPAIAPVEDGCPRCFPIDDEPQEPRGVAVITPIDAAPKAAAAPRASRPRWRKKSERPITSAAIVLPKSVHRGPGQSQRRRSAPSLWVEAVPALRPSPWEAQRSCPSATSKARSATSRSSPWRSWTVRPSPILTCLRNAYGDLLKDPKAMARHLVEKLGAEIISVRLATCHPDNGDMSPEAAGDIVKDVLRRGRRARRSSPVAATTKRTTR